MTTKEFAELFGMSVAELARFTGYDRTTLYRIIEGDQEINGNRYKAMERLLIQKAQLDYNNQINQAAADRNRRMAALEKLHNFRRRVA